MQKLMRRSPSGPILCTAGNSPTPFLSLSFTTTTTTNSNSFLSLGFKNKSRSFLPLVPPPQPKMPAATTFHLRPSTGSSAIAAAALGKKPTARFSSTTSCRICRCSIDNRVPVRAWAVFKESRTGSLAAWFHTASDKGLPVAAAAAAEDSKNLEADVENDGESEKGLSESAGSEEKPRRLHRRQRVSSTGGGAVAALPGNPDLLTIPGVGPRNLRKLVEKGIGGVGELKQLYKDKAFVFSLTLCMCVFLSLFWGL
uniref:Uncharacterized protein n=1 Tax=Davidia involucrata TaxID=16924 RepID=A0A5B7BTR4_DAVIN